jgi:hypothetical protein
MFLCFLAPLLAQPQSQPPPPIPAVKRDQPKQPAANIQKQSSTNERGSDKSPIVVEVLPTAEAQQKTADNEANGLDKSSADWWMVRLTGAIVFLGCIQTVVFWVQARRLKQTIDKMEEISRQQTSDVQASITQATRAATAMERTAESMAASVKFVRETVEINREIADRQELVAELQSRAYLTIVFEGVAPQNIETGFRFEPRVRIENRGNTPAHTIRFAAFADVIPFPLPDDFRFSLPTELPGHSATIGPGLHKIVSAVVPKLYPAAEANQIASGEGQRIIAWGIVKYQDAFDIERFLRFGLTCVRIGETQWMCQDTTENNDSD